MVTVRRRSFGAVWAVALLVIGLLSAGGGSGGAGVDASGRALAAVSSVVGSAAHPDVVVPRVDGRIAVSAKLAPDHPGDLAVAAVLFALVLPGLVWWRRALGHGRRPDKLNGVCGARGPPSRRVTP